MESFEICGDLVPHVFGFVPIIGAWDASRALPESASVWELSFVVAPNHETLEFKFLLKSKDRERVCLVEERPGHLLTGGNLEGDVLSAVLRVHECGDSQLLECRVSVKTDIVSPFALAASWRAYKENSRPSTVSGVPDKYAGSLVGSIAEFCLAVVRVTWMLNQSSLEAESAAEFWRALRNVLKLAEIKLKDLSSWNAFFCVCFAGSEISWIPNGITLVSLDVDYKLIGIPGGSASLVLLEVNVALFTPEALLILHGSTDIGGSNTRRDPIQTVQTSQYKGIGRQIHSGMEKQAVDSVKFGVHDSNHNQASHNSLYIP
ncbi:6-phosphofructo-2-kinase/fructose-2,6-bisphosphatase [Apostasia shenzhenica]|uniref:6-phosphofructo-2-kinase/fructose-2, 6-bisphosphatase n=1 Tax=Apostasia shenzhenica TaxID=1088818 RepID=A0A2I0AKW7_9ASPA|nr:6-phosphofructo-2-kinase/fructose-2,6-bisphosphatase [Apostasia shenzhenica]